MRKKNQVKNSPADEGLFQNLPSVTLYGASHADIDNFKGLLDFSRDTIGIATSGGVVRINGSNLEICVVTDESVSVKGAIKSLEYE